MDYNRCVICGRYTAEDRQVCQNCIKDIEDGIDVHFKKTKRRRKYDLLDVLIIGTIPVLLVLFGVGMIMAFRS